MIRAIDAPAPTEADPDGWVSELTAGAPGRLAQFRSTGDLDTASSSPGLPRFRVNAFRQRGAPVLA